MKAPQMWLQTPCVYALWPLALGLPTCNNNNYGSSRVHLGHIMTTEIKCKIWVCAKFDGAFIKHKSSSDSVGVITVANRRLGTSLESDERR